MDFAVPADHKVKLKVGEKGEKYLELAKELKKLWNMKLTVIPIVIGTLSTITKSLLQGQGNFGNKRMRGDTLKCTMVEIGQNTKKRPVDLRRLAVTQTFVENHQQSLVWNTLKWVIIIMIIAPTFTGILRYKRVRRDKSRSSGEERENERKGKDRQIFGYCQKDKKKTIVRGAFEIVIKCREYRLGE